MTATHAQVRIIMKERQKGRTQEQAAAKANLHSTRTVRKYERLGKLPGELKQPRVYRTRKDPFEAHWPEASRNSQYGHREERFLRRSGLWAAVGIASPREKRPGFASA
jgi:hypothetical protein